MALQEPRIERRMKAMLRVHLVVIFTLIVYCLYAGFQRGDTSLAARLSQLTSWRNSGALKVQRATLQAQCANVRAAAGPPASFNPSSRLRDSNDHWVPGTPPTLIRNAKIWTGAGNGTEIVSGDVLLDRGLVVGVGSISARVLQAVRKNSRRDGSKAELRVVDVGGKWVTPGLVDLHSHIGVYSAPELNGAQDGNSRKAPIQPWLRSIDGLNTHDDSYELAISGGVTTAQILPGSANNIGGQAFVIKLRETAERSATAKVIEPPYLPSNSSGYRPWRHMKHACGENINNVYSQVRMDAIWNFRQAYDQARKVRDAQDAFCVRVEAGDWESLKVNENAYEEFPENLQWESLVDVLRGRVKLSAVDFDGIVRLSNEFKFPVASFHHGGEAYLITDLLKKTYGGAPALALFASNFRKKREAYRGSEFAPAILAENGVPVVMKSDHPVLNSRYLIFEAQQAHYHGLSPELALSSVTSVSAKAAGLDHRVGSIAEGYDADVVIWDSHPLNLGATPVQVYIDGIEQLKDPFVLNKPEEFQKVPEVPDFSKERADTVKYSGLPPLTGWKDEKKQAGRVKVVGVKSLVAYEESTGAQDDTPSFALKTLFDDKHSSSGRTVIIEGGRIVCIEGTASSCTISVRVGETIDLQGGSIAPALTTYGSPLGLVEIRQEASTNDGSVPDPLTGSVPSIVRGTGDGVIRAVDGLSFGGRSTLLAYKDGVTTAITAPSGGGFQRGLATAFDTGAPHSAVDGAVLQEETALHIAINFQISTSVSTQVAALRSLLFAGGDEEDASAWGRVRAGKIPLVVAVQSADIIATLLSLKADYEEATGRTLKLTFSGATEAHLLASEIAEAGVSVILTSPRPYPGSWEQRRIVHGPPLSQESTVTTLVKAGVNVGIGVIDEASGRNTRFDVAWTALEANGTISKSEAIALASTNLHKALGYSPQKTPDLVLYRGGDLFGFESKVVGIVSAQRGVEEF
ncbi:unnamed protein product [Cyclocybe aegerita]|uniref:Amidohydrolase-related domain-containing protein n=1 Tax=Cyclocybe aegerita TaxID=1973307 RepID=A0A8S0X1R5_CYCAE|nr:unnamed protein product [Cyclocybe aegerita]